MVEDGEEESVEPHETCRLAKGRDMIHHEAQEALVESSP